MKSTLLTIENMFAGSGKISLSNFIGRFGPESYLVLIFILISPNLIPFLCQFGIAEFTSGMVCLLSLQLMSGREIPWLPKRVADKEISCERIARVGNKLFPLLYKLDLLTRNRLSALSDIRTYRFYGFMFFVLSFLILLPLPFFNYAPAAVIMLSVMGLMSKDGFFLMLGMALFLCIIAGFVYTISMIV